MLFHLLQVTGYHSSNLLSSMIGLEKVNLELLANGKVVNIYFVNN